jgi:opacity protein-like surface antigen
MKKLSVFIFSLAILFMVYPLQSAFAQTGGYFGIWGGYTINPFAGSGDYEYDHHDDDWEWDYHYDYDLDIEETFALGAKAGFVHPLLKYLAFEFEYSYLNPDIDRSIIDKYGSHYVAVQGDIKLNNFMFNIIGKYPRGVFHPYIGVGLGLSSSDVSAIATDGSSSSVSIGDTHTSFAWQLLTGMEIDLANNLALDIGYRYFVTELEFNHKMEFDYDTSRDIDFETSMITLGVKFMF